MPSKIHWTINPKKWFGGGHAANKNTDLNANLPNRIPTTKVTPVKSNAPQFLTNKNKSRITPISISVDSNKINGAFVTPISQLRLPAFSARRERTLPVFSATVSSHQTNTYVPTHTEPTIRKNARLDQELVIDTTRCNNPPASTAIYDIKKSENIEKPRRTSNFQTNSSISNCCLIDYPRYSSNLMDVSSFPTRSMSSLSNYDNDDSTSSGIFTDDRQRTESKDTLSILEVLSVESLIDSQPSINQFNNRPVIHHYRRPLSGFEMPNSITQRKYDSGVKSHRSHSAEGILNDNQMIPLPRSRQSSALIAKKIERRRPTSRSSTANLEKAGFVRIGIDSYRLAVKEMESEPRSRKGSADSFIPYANPDDSLRAANDEESYAHVPRTSSTEQLNNGTSNDLRVLIDECIRPVATTFNKTRLTKPYQPRYRRSQNQNGPLKLNIDDITDKLFSSVNCSAYARFQRCY